jgi:metal-responsive CopG/Arc/MetJ family transcriptional regulator
MERTTISLPAEVLQRLRVIAAERRISMAEIVREAVEEKLTAYRPKPRSIGLGASGRSDTARLIGDAEIEPSPWR